MASRLQCLAHSVQILAAFQISLRTLIFIACKYNTTKPLNRYTTIDFGHGIATTAPCQYVSITDSVFPEGGHALGASSL